MRILLLLLIAGLCLVTAKYIPHELNDANFALHRVRRSDSQDSDSNTASVERDDDSSNNNDKDDSEDNDSAEKIINEERNKLREKEEKKKQKLLEKQEKEKQKEIEDKKKLEEKLAKEQRKEAEKREKEQRKLQERIEKEKQKLEEEKRKEAQKLEKEEKKRQEKLNKQLVKLQKEQEESAEDTYLETEEEDSVEIEDIWKVHVYDKYGISITSNKLERQAALQRYLQEEMGIAPNSTKSERRQAILKLIQTKLQNDSAAVNSFRNLLLSHVNAAQIQKLKSKLDKDFEELNNQTQLLNNVSLPWVSVAQQNIQEKRTFLQAIAQFLSNIVPSWFTGGQPINNSTQTNGNEVLITSGIPVDSAISNDTSGSENPLQLAAASDIASLGDGENNLSVLPSNNGSGSSSNNPSESNGSLGSETLNNNIPAEQSNINEISSNTDYTADANSINAPIPVIPDASNNPPQAGSDTVNTISVNQSSIDELPVTVDDLANSTSLHIPVSPGTGLESDNSLGLNGSTDSGSLVSNVPDIQTHINSQFYDTNQLLNNVSSNQPESVNSVSTSSSPQGSGASTDNDSTNNNISVNSTSVNDLPSSAINVGSSDLTNIAASIDAEATLGNSIKPNIPVDSGSLNNDVDINNLAEINTPIPSQSNGSVDNFNDNTDHVVNQDNGIDIRSNIGTSGIPVSPKESSSSISEGSTNILPQPEESNVNGSYINLATGETGGTDDVTIASSSLSGVISFAETTDSSVIDLSESKVTGQADVSGGNVKAPTSVDLESSTTALNGSLNSSSNDKSTDNSASGQSDITINAHTLPTISQLLNAGSDAIPLTDSIQFLDSSSVTSASDYNASIDNGIAVTSTVADDINKTPAESSTVNTTEKLIFENAATENIVLNDNTDEAVSTNDSNGFLFSTDGAVQVTDVISVSNNNTAANVIVENNGLDNSTLIASTANESATPNLEAVTDIILLNTQVDQNPIEVDRTVPTVEASIVTNNADADVLITDSPTPALGETNDVTQIATQTEPDNFLVKEIVNTPSDLVTVPTIQESSPLPPDVIVPVEEAASIIDVKEQ